MRTRTRLLLAALSATVIMALAIGSASARRIEISPKQTFLIKWETEKLHFTDASGTSVWCKVTLDGSFHSKTISKVSGQLIGYIYSTALNECEGGTATVLTETLPWHIQYNSFAGTLPRITSVTQTLIGAAFRIEVAGNLCLTRTTQSNPGWGRANVEANGKITSFDALREHTIPLTGGGFCETFFVSPGHFEGNARVDEGYPGTTAVTIRLVQ